MRRRSGGRPVHGDSRRRAAGGRREALKTLVAFERHDRGRAGRPGRHRRGRRRDRPRRERRRARDDQRQRWSCCSRRRAERRRRRDGRVVERSLVNPRHRGVLGALLRRGVRVAAPRLARRRREPRARKHGRCIDPGESGRARGAAGLGVPMLRVARRDRRSRTVFVCRLRRRNDDRLGHHRREKWRRGRGRSRRRRRRRAKAKGVRSRRRSRRHRGTQRSGCCRRRRLRECGGALLLRRRRRRGHAGEPRMRALGRARFARLARVVAAVRARLDDVERRRRAVEEAVETARAVHRLEVWAVVDVGRE